MVAEANKVRAVWWLNPAIAFGMPAVAAGCAAYVTGSGDYLYFWRTPKYFDLSCLGLLLAAVLIFGCGCLFGAARRSNSGRRRPSGDWKLAVPWRSVRLIFTISFILTVLAYSVWFAVGIKNGLNLRLILDILHRASDANYDLRKEYFKTIPGVTTATQFGLTVIVLGIPLGVARGWRPVRWQLLAVFVLGLVRALLNSERLAVIELLVPLVVSFIWLRPAAGRLLRFLTQLAPVVAAAFFISSLRPGSTSDRGPVSTQIVNPPSGASSRCGLWAITPRRSIMERYCWRAKNHSPCICRSRR